MDLTGKNAWIFWALFSEKLVVVKTVYHCSFHPSSSSRGWSPSPRVTAMKMYKMLGPPGKISFSLPWHPLLIPLVSRHRFPRNITCLISCRLRNHIQPASRYCCWTLTTPDQHHPRRKPGGCQWNFPSSYCAQSSSSANCLHYSSPLHPSCPGESFIWACSIKGCCRPAWWASVPATRTSVNANGQFWLWRWQDVDQHAVIPSQLEGCLWPFHQCCRFNSSTMCRKWAN